MLDKGENCLNVNQDTRITMSDECRTRLQAIAAETLGSERLAPPQFGKQMCVSSVFEGPDDF